MIAQQLVLDFIDERYEADPGDELTFGRSAIVVLDDRNEFMSRTVGAFVFHEGSWWLQNRSSSAQLTVVADSGQQTLLPPGTSDPITVANGRIRFTAGPSNYELAFELPEPPATPSAPTFGTGDIDRTGKPTAEFGIIPLNDEQRAMLALFAESRLRDPGAPHHELPPNAEVAHQLGWSLKKLDRKLDYLCARLSSAGVQGLRGERGGEATDRRRRLIDHILSVQLISADDIPAR
ncbi:MAG: hypothetical protein AAGA93_07145 [Actinomycetota bacterium]